LAGTFGLGALNANGLGLVTLLVDLRTDLMGFSGALPLPFKDTSGDGMRGLTGASSFNSIEATWDWMVVLEGERELDPNNGRSVRGSVFDIDSPRRDLPSFEEKRVSRCSLAAVLRARVFWALAVWAGDRTGSLLGVLLGEVVAAGARGKGEKPNPNGPSNAGSATAVSRSASRGAKSSMSMGSRLRMGVDRLGGDATVNTGIMTGARPFGESMSDTYDESGSTSVSDGPLGLSGVKAIKSAVVSRKVGALAGEERAFAEAENRSKLSKGDGARGASGLLAGAVRASCDDMESSAASGVSRSGVSCLRGGKELVSRGTLARTVFCSPKGSSSLAPTTTAVSSWQARGVSAPPFSSSDSSSGSELTPWRVTFSSTMGLKCLLDRTGDGVVGWSGHARLADAMDAVLDRALDVLSPNDIRSPAPPVSLPNSRGTSSGSSMSSKLSPPMSSSGESSGISACWGAAIPRSYWPSQNPIVMGTLSGGAGT
jgi:hypothetical protein